MSIFALLSLLVVLAALFSYFNYKYLRLPPTIGVMVLALIASLALIGIGNFVPGLHLWAAQRVDRIDFDKVVLRGLLAFLLFAGSLHLDLAELAREKVAISLLAFLATLISTVLVGFGAFAVFQFCGLSVSLTHCFLLGALISPTDPIAVLAIMKKVGASKALEIRMDGESLFNDGIGVVFFLTILELSAGDTTPTPAGILWLLIKEAGGGAAIGLAAGYVTYRMLKRVDNYQVEILLTLALAMGGYAFADTLHVSAPITAVIAGLFIGNHGRAFAMSPKTRQNLDTFWELIDSILNAVLFLLLGLVLLVVPFDKRFIAAGLLAIPITLIARWLSVAGIIAPLRQRLHFERGSIRILTWGALRGSISVAMALSLPKGPDRDPLLTVTYLVVIFTIVVQGLTVGRLIHHLAPKTATPAAPT